MGTTKTGGTGFASSLEGGYPFQLGRDWVIEPQAQVVYQTVGLDDTADSAAAVHFHDVDSLAARVGDANASYQTGFDYLCKNVSVRPQLLRYRLVDGD